MVDHEELTVHIGQLFQQVLGAPSVSDDGDFFESGGNSVLALELVASAVRAGIPLQSEDVFRHPTPRTLAAAALKRKASADALPNGDAHAPARSAQDVWPLTPIQHWFFDRFQAPHRVFALADFDVVEPIDLEALTDAVNALITRHGALRTQFKPTHGSWQHTWLHDCDATKVLAVCQLESTDSAHLEREVARATDAARLAMQLGSGPLVRFVLLRLGEQAIRLVVAAHHLVCDVRSLRILMEDLETSYRHAVRSEDRRSPSGEHRAGGLGSGSSLPDWARWIGSDSQLRAARSEMALWADRQVAKIPLDYPDGDNIEQRELALVVAAERVTALATLARVRFRANVKTLLLTALCRTVVDWARDPTVLINMVEAGRQVGTSALDLSRTVGWLTWHWPFLFRATDDETMSATVERVIDHLDAVPDDGMRYGILRFLADDIPPSQLLPEPDVGFNYLGDMDAAFANVTLFRLRGGTPGGGFVENARRPRPFSLFCSLSGGALLCRWLYSPSLHDAKTVKAVSDRFESRLTELLSA